MTNTTLFLDGSHDNSQFLYSNKYRFYIFNKFRLNNPYKILNRRLQTLKNTTTIPIIRTIPGTK